MWRTGVNIERPIMGLKSRRMRNGRIEKFDGRFHPKLPKLAVNNVSSRLTNNSNLRFTRCQISQRAAQKLSGSVN